MSSRSVTSNLVIATLGLAFGMMLSCEAAGGSLFGSFDNAHYIGPLWAIFSAVYCAVVWGFRKQVHPFVGVFGLLAGFAIDWYAVLPLMDWKTYSVFGFIRPIVFTCCALILAALLLQCRRLKA